MLRFRTCCEARTGAAMSAEDRLERAKTLYEQAVYSGDASVLTDAERGLDAVEADAALARGRILHARFLNERQRRLVTRRGPGRTAVVSARDPAVPGAGRRARRGRGV